MKNNITALTIAGSDSGGGAGIQADLKTFSALGIYGTTAITVITAQNLNKINDIFVLPENIIRKQIETIFDGYSIKAAKTGILYSEKIIDIIIHSFANRDIKLVIDPVMISTSGKALMDKKALEKITDGLFPIANLITPNIPEAEYLTNSIIDSKEDMQKAVSILYNKYKVPFLLKGGHMTNISDDLLITDEGINIFSSERISGVNTHGSGCTLSAAITAFLCQDYALYEAVRSAKEYIKSTLLDPIQISDKTQIINHFADY